MTTVIDGGFLRINKKTTTIRNNCNFQKWWYSIKVGNSRQTKDFTKISSLTTQIRSNLQQNSSDDNKILIKNNYNSQFL